MASDATNEGPNPVADGMDEEKFVQELAETKKEAANKYYAIKQYKTALAGYNQAIELCPNCAKYYANRAACYMMLGQYYDALQDAKKCIQIDPKWFKAYNRVIKCCLFLGDITEAERTINKLLELDPDNESVLTEKGELAYVQKFLADAEAAYAAKDYRKVVYCMDRCCSVSKSCDKFKSTKAECLMLLGRYEEAQEIATNILHSDEKNTDALYIRGICLYYHDNIDSALACFQHVLRLAPDHNKTLAMYKLVKSLKIKKENGNMAFKMEQFQEAHRLYTEALAIDPQNVITNAKLHFNKAMVAAKMRNWSESVQECTEALKLDENYFKARLRRASSYMELEQYEEAIQDLEKACLMNKTREIKRRLYMAKLALKKSKQKDYYKILGIDKNASTDDIKKAYKKGAMVHHPDRHANATEDEKKEQEKKFKEVGEAYGILSDPKKRLRYDNGNDIDDGHEAYQGPSFDFNVIFQTFFDGCADTEPTNEGYNFYYY